MNYISLSTRDRILFRVSEEKRIEVGVVLALYQRQLTEFTYEEAAAWLGVQRRYISVLAREKKLEKIRKGFVTRYSVMKYNSLRPNLRQDRYLKKLLNNVDTPLELL